MIEEKKEEIKILMASIFPHCSEGFIEEVLKLTELHSKKNNDYNGKSQLYLYTGIKGRISDVWRKVIRIMTLGWDGNPAGCEESLEENSRDLSVYAILLTIILKK